MRRIALALVWLATTGCDGGLDVALTQQIEAQRLAADMRVQLHRSAEAAQRAIMADTDEASADFAREAREAADALEADRRAIGPILAEIGTDAEQRRILEFSTAFGALQQLDRALLPLATENSNMKAQRLAFGPAREAADALRDHLERARRTAMREEASRAELLAARVQLAVREIQALQAPHIAEADAEAMTRLEKQMGDAEADARAALDDLVNLMAPRVEPQLVAAREQLDRFAQIQRELVALSRANSDVRSLASALGERPERTATCDAALILLQEELGKRELRATR
jgi:hypothetical protein